MKKLLYVIYVWLLYPISPLRSFEFFIKKVEGKSQQEWEKYLNDINESNCLKKFFRIK